MGPKWTLLDLIVLFLWVYQSQCRMIEIISIVDKASIFYCLVKIHSIIFSSQHPSLLSFRFLSLDSESELVLLKYFSNCQKKIRYEVVSWESVPSHLPSLSAKGFDSRTIYSRIYLPVIFNIDKYIYLDNDIVVNGDLEELFYLELLPKIDMDLLPKSKQRPVLANRESDSNPAIIGFVYDFNHIHISYLNSHFNRSHPFVRSVLAKNHPELFFNGGVAVVNAQLWRKENITSKAENLLMENFVHSDSLYHSKAVGDQGLFYLLLDGKIAALPQHYNMRRLPNKTVRFLEHNQLGIIHFAGTTYGKATALCDSPLQYPNLSQGALPLFLSIIASLSNQCPSINYLIPDSCWTAISAVVEAEKQGSVVIKYAGPKEFLWPPSQL